ncbi:MAG: DUF4340 domain-containing protein [bacterium]|nr:DUF4340 domain-containing protein [bacterium]
MKRSLILLVILLVLIGVYWAVQSSRPVAKADRPFVETDTAKVVTLRIEAAGETVELTRRGAQWFVTKPLEFPAAARNVEQALGRLSEMKMLTLITNRAERFAEFQVDDSAGLGVTVTDDQTTTAFRLGKAGPTGGTCYARLEGSNDVWEIAGNQTPAFKRAAKDWRDKTISEYDRENFVKFTLEFPDQLFTLTLVDTVWKVEAGTEKFDADKNQVSRLTGLLSRMSGVDFADTLSAAAFESPACRVVAEFASGEPLDLRLIPKSDDANQYYVRKAGALADYVIYKSTAEVLMRKLSEYKPKPATTATQG